MKAFRKVKRFSFSRGSPIPLYKLEKPDAIRVANSINSIKTIEKYLIEHNAVLV